jgi:hypothetical protein
VIADARALTRLSRLIPLALKALQRLQGTDARLFAEPMTAEKASRLAEDDLLAERVEAFVSRFGRVQDMLGDKLLPTWLAAHGERLSAFSDNLDRAEKLGLIADAQRWLDMRRLRNQMVHEYVEDPLVLANALTAAHDYLPVLARFIAHIAASLPQQGAMDKEDTPCA